MKPEPVRCMSAFVGDHDGEAQIQAELYEDGGVPEVGLHTLEPGNPDPLSSLYLPVVDAVVLAERITAVARTATTTTED